jgi:gamma-glutamylcyclotransferase
VSGRISNVTDSWYFAYGSNLDPKRKENRTGPIREARVAVLDGYDIVFNKRGKDGSGKANIVPRKAETVWGIAFRCSPGALSDLDKCEGIDGGDYQRAIVRVRCESGEEVDAVTYIAGASFVGTSLIPSDDYVQMILRGARHYRLPENHIRKIERAANRGQERRER